MRVILVDDAVLLREGLARLLTDAGIEVLIGLGDATDLDQHLDRLNPDLVILDIRMPPTNTTEGLDAALRIRAERPGQAVLLLSQHVETHDAMSLLEEDGASVGYLLKDRIVDVDHFVADLRRITAGDTVIDPLIVTRLLQRERRTNPLQVLSTRETDVLALMAEGHTNDAIATELALNVRTVETHIANVFNKLTLPPETSTHRRVKAVLTYLRNVGA